MKPKIQVDFIITGVQITPDEITRLVGINPTHTWLLGDSIQRTNLKRKHNGWCFSVKKAKKGLDLEELIIPLIEVLKPKAELIRKVCRENKLSSELSCAIYLIDETPSINLNKDVLSSIADLHADLDIDIILTK